MSLLTLNTVSKKYMKNSSLVTAVDSASLELSAGDFVAIGGESGSGKTTLLLIAGALLKPDTGDANIDNLSVYTQNRKQRAQMRAQKIGFIFQQFHLIPYLSVSDNIQAPALALGGIESKERTMYLLEKFRLGHRAKHFPSELSVGEKQRVACARALYNKPSIILADEPTGNLDSKNAETVLSFLYEFSRKDGGVIMVTHNETALGFADRVLRMNNGVLKG